MILYVHLRIALVCASEHYSSNADDLYSHNILNYQL